MCDTCAKLLDKVDKLQAKVLQLRMSRRVLMSIVEELINQKTIEINNLKQEKSKLEQTNQKYLIALAQKNEILIDLVQKIKID